MTQPMPFPIPYRASSTPSGELSLTLLGPSPAMAQLWTQLRRVAAHVRTVLLTGDSDCGQEAVARLLLDFSPHGHRAFLILSAAEAEGRLLRPSGLVSFPSDVLLFLPDAHKLSRAAQGALLRLLKMRRARAFTVIAATAEDLRSLVALGRFSPELADTLGAMRLALPSLKERAEDIPMLVNHLLATYSAKHGHRMPNTSADFLRAAMAHPWSGNLRELSQILAWLCSHAEGDVLHAADLHRAIASQHPSRAPEPAPVRLVPLDTVVQEHIVAVLSACRGNKLRAAETLGISRSTLYRMLDTAAVAHSEPLPLAS